MFTKLLLLTSLASSLTLSPVSTQPTLPTAIQATLVNLKLDKNYHVITRTKEYTVISTDAGILTFIGNDGSFVNSSVFKIDTDSQTLSEATATAFYKELAQYRDMFINVVAPNEKAHSYVIFSIKCQYCLQLIAHLKDFQDAGISLTFVPYVSPATPEDNKLYNYLLEQDNATRVSLIQKPAKLQPSSNTSRASIIAQDLMRKYHVASYPTFITFRGNMYNGYVEAPKLARFLNIK